MNRIVLIIFGVLLATGAVAMACHVFYEFKTGEDFRIYLPWTNDGNLTNFLKFFSHKIILA